MNVRWNFLSCELDFLINNIIHCTCICHQLLPFGVMSMSSANVTVVIEYRDSFTKAVTKNVIVVVLGISINYINVGLIQTFSKYQV